MAKQGKLKSFLGFDYHRQLLSEIKGRPIYLLARMIAGGIADESIYCKIFNGTRNASAENLARIYNWLGYDFIVIIRPAHHAEAGTVVKFTSHGHLSTATFMCKMTDTTPQSESDDTDK